MLKLFSATLGLKCRTVLTKLLIGMLLLENNIALWYKEMMVEWWDVGFKTLKSYAAICMCKQFSLMQEEEL